MQMNLFVKIYRLTRSFRHVLLVLFFVGIICDIFYFNESSDWRIFPLLFFYIFILTLYRANSSFVFICDFIVLGFLFFLYITTGTAVNTEKAAVWWILLLIVGVIKQWRELTHLEFKKSITDILMISFKKISSLIYYKLGPEYSFKLAMSPFGKFLFNLLTGQKKEITFTTKYGFLMKMHTYEYLMSGYFFMGESNPYETKILRKMLQKGDTFFDVGAHIGVYSLNAAQVVGSSGTVVAFEPNPACYASLDENININKFKNIKVEKIALAEKEGSFDFWLGDDMGGSFIKQNTERLTIDRKVTKTKVNAITLDQYCATKKIKKITLMKIDVEGAEMQVLQGAMRTLKTVGPDLIIEVIDDTLQKNKSSKKEVFSFLESFGYHSYSFTPHGLRSYNSDDTHPAVNIYFSKKILTTS